MIKINNMSAPVENDYYIIAMHHSIVGYEHESLKTYSFHFTRSVSSLLMEHKHITSHWN